MLIKYIEAGPVCTNSYLVYDENSKEAVLVDAPPDSAVIITEYMMKEALELKAVFLTHSHWDHTMDAPVIREKTGAKIYIHKDDEHRLTQPNNYTSIPLPFEIEAFAPNDYYNQGDYLKIGGITFEIRHTPGHTEGGVCIVEHINKTVFTGDTLFNKGVGRVDLPGGDWQTLISSISKKLFTLPDDYVVYCGHGPSTSIAQEKHFNPFLLNN